MFASGNALAPPVLAELQAAGLPIGGLVTPGAGPLRRLGERRVVHPADVKDHALAAGIPAWVAPDAASAESVLHELEPSLVVVACLAWRLGPAFWDRAVNVHPSLLPAFRGPDPLVWQYRAGAPTGVSVHFVSREIDAGDLVAQAAVEIPDDATHHEAEALLGRVGGRLLAEALARGPLPRRPQPAEGASRQGWPGAADLRPDPAWTARRRARFTSLLRGR
jgi:methionyl-tRNA formyltransferase